MMGRTHALSGLVTGVAIGQFWWLVAVVEKIVPAGRLPLH
jgi:hypothetical protein